MEQATMIATEWCNAGDSCSRTRLSARLGGGCIQRARTALNGVVEDVRLSCLEGERFSVTELRGVCMIELITPCGSSCRESALGRRKLRKADQEVRLSKIAAAARASVPLTVSARYAIMKQSFAAERDALVHTRSASYAAPASVC